MPWAYKKVLIVGATSGIGEALANRLIAAGSNVIVSGRRQEKLDEFVHRHGKDKSSAAQIDVTELDKIPHFAEQIIKSHPDLDCIVLNSGIQRTMDFTKPETVDIAKIEFEFKTNYISFLALTKAFLPFLQSKKDESALIYTTSGLAYVPIIRCVNYCATKAALHQFILVIREQLKDTGSKIKVIEIVPPAVQTELHDEKHQPEIKDGRSVGMPLKDFTDETFSGLENGNEQIPIGPAKKWFSSFEAERQQTFKEYTEMIKKGAGP